MELVLTPSGEAFTKDYDLPNDTNYAETCASVGLMFFAQRMLQCETDAVYGDVMEQALYNTVLGGMNYEGNRFFYVNPLESVPAVCEANPERHHVRTLRRKWFACACCPPNLARLIGSLRKYMYTVGENRINVQLYIAGTARLKTGGQTLLVVQKTDYPKEGKRSHKGHLIKHEAKPLARQRAGSKGGYIGSLPWEQEGP